MPFIPNRVASETKFSTANTFYMITTDVFLNRLFACGTFSCVFLNPEFIIFLLICKFTPFLNFETRSRLMRLLLTFKTVDSTTRTFDIILLNYGRFLTEELTVVRWTVTNGLVYNGIINTNLPFIQF